MDARGAFVSLSSAAVLIATFLPWYDVTGSGVSTSPAAGALAGSATLLDPGFGGWRVLVPAIALCAVVGGVVDALIRAGQRGAMFSFVALRALVLAQVALVIAAMVARDPHGIGTGSGLQMVVSLRWPAWGALAAASIAVCGSLASARRPTA